MSELRPYYHQPAAPLTAGARFVRGFKRIGIVAAVLIFLGGLATTFFVAADQQQSAQRRFEQAACIADLVRSKRPFKMKTYDQTSIDFSESGCPGYSFYREPVETILVYARVGPPAPLEYAIQPFLIGLAITMVCGAITSFAFWMIGWLFAGFTRYLAAPLVTALDAVHKGESRLACPSKLPDNPSRARGRFYSGAIFKEV